jgi:hypothetical protein
MSHPGKYVVGPLGLGMTALGMLIVLGVLAVVALNAYRVLPLRRSRRTYWIGMTLLGPLTLAGILLSPQAVQALAVIASFGWDAYAEGLRVINKHGQLSDGRYLGVFWAAAMGGWVMPMAFMMCLPLTAWYMHYNPSCQPGHGVEATGVVPLDGASASQ